jgi:serine phosphatase RsbU (regulator of sigma subunit)
MAAESSNDGREDGSTHLVSVRVTLPEPERREERGHYLVVVSGLHPGRRFLVGAEPITLGRVAPCEIVIADTEISRAHCRVEGTGEDLLVTDLGSTNGTYVDGKRIAGSGRIANGGTLRIGRQLLRHDLRIRKEVVAAEQLENDLAAARSYVDSQLPARLTEGFVLTDWLFEPSARIGGDALGYHRIDQDHFALYLLDVAGHGPGAALHAAAVLNVLRKQALPGVDMRRSEDVLSGLNEMFPMEEHRDMFFTAWYGVYRRADRQIRYCCGGHHPGYLVGPGRETATPLWTRNPLLGAKRGHAYSAASATVVPGSRLYLFSDGLFEVQAATGQMQGLDDFVPLLLAGGSGDTTEPERLMASVRRMTESSAFEDDVTLLVATFP